MKKTLNIVKIGGNILDAPDALDAFLRAYAKLEGDKILIHGGGKIATTLGIQLGIQARYVDGRRITDTPTLELVTMVYGGRINRQITASLQALGCNAIGLTGADGNLLRAVKRPVGAVDYGWVGDVAVSDVNTGLLNALFAAGLSPVVAPLTHDGQGQIFNTNADTMAAILAQAMAPLHSVSLFFCFEKKGILADPEDENSALLSLSENDYHHLRETKALSGGIFPKIDNAFAAAKTGVHRVMIGEALALMNNPEAGTRLIP
ncbi:MAG: acetylglutamate kinase [Saprospiraceae bacterium]|nr:acetylglutamate kinase [Saprospiraceae bacterium]